MQVLRDHIEAHSLTQEDAAELFEVSQPRISDLVNGKVEKFSIDGLVSMLSKAGLRTEVRVEPVK